MTIIDTIFNVVASLKYIDFLGLQNSLSDEQLDYKINVFHEFESTVSWNKYLKLLRNDKGVLKVSPCGFETDFYLKRAEYEWIEIDMIIKHHFSRILPNNLNDQMIKIMALSK